MTPLALQDVVPSARVGLEPVERRGACGVRGEHGVHEQLLFEADAGTVESRPVTGDAALDTGEPRRAGDVQDAAVSLLDQEPDEFAGPPLLVGLEDRKSTRLNSSH